MSFDMRIENCHTFHVEIGDNTPRPKTHFFCNINNATWRLLHARNFFVQKIYFFCIITVSQLYSIVVFFRFIAYSGCISLHSPLFMTRQQIVKRNTWKVRLRKRRRKCWQSVVCKISCVDEKRVVHELDNSNHLCYLVTLSKVLQILLTPMKKVTFDFSINFYL